VLQRKVRGRVEFTNSDRLFFIQLYRWFPSILKAMMIIRPETLERWHRAGMRRYWRWKSRNPGGRPRINVMASCSSSTLRWLAAMDLFVVPTTGFKLLYVLVIVRLARRELVWINVTAYPTAEWIAQKITEAFPWNEVHAT
jgi:hypothetical protein